MKFNFDPRGVETVYQLSLIRRLFETLESQLGEVQARTIKELESEFSIDSQDAYDMLCCNLGSQEQHHEVQACALRSAELVRLYMLLEKELRSFWKAIKLTRGIAKDFGDFKSGSLIKRAQALMGDHAKLIPPKDPIWTELEDFRIVRVHLVHSADENSNQRAVDEFKNLIARRAELKLWDGFELTLERSTCDHFQDVVKRFFMTLFDAVGWKAFRQTGPIVVDD
jgi:hypothetical protein